ncbi:MAG: hypothetical protein A2010_05365 [Nitrospirae bacterium GWD2_57_9]|nr:MAG: hypothetical protein A2010_05365 [Nitrospirae bacterium GWD2_57_9]OGW48232.1 MAG: hypothetical protein A2078_08620 [Nitrospirae bacterium GWC2_57_9]
MRDKVKKLFLAGTLVYLLIGLEILIMISPFAAYFYSVYGPFLVLVDSAASTRWLAEFFLPHFVFVDNLFLKILGALQLATFFSGMFLFLYAAIPLYYSKFRKQGVLTRGIYERVRHPQYLGLGIAGFGLLLYWPRFFILITFITMLFVYYLLAKNEELRMTNSQPETYDEYKKRVPMFLPGNIGGRLFNRVFGPIRPKGLALVLLYCVVLFASVGTGMLLRSYSAGAININPVNGLSTISVLPETDFSVPELMRSITANQEIAKRTASGDVTLAYVMPSDFFLMALVTDLERFYPPDFERPAGGTTIKRFFKIFSTYTKMQMGIYAEPHPLKRIIFVSVKDADGRLLNGRDVFRIGARRYPVFHVDLNAQSREIVSIQDLKHRHKWGTMAMPLF